ncbi:MAG: hydrogenase nickel incorporation protein HypB [Candidatus Eremiobacteraeota bacterium]|nr:hydrogenase nickel incorporation protein HypB [Candidatus Eremiobacteraeota bacterium]
MEIKVTENILSKNDQIALETTKLLAEKKIYCINMMSSPGSGKTTILERTIPAIMDKIRVGVIEGDVATHIDAERIEKFGIPTVQITTDKFGGACHLSAKMIADVIEKLPLDELDFVVIENVGNLICPAGFKVGSNADVVVQSLAEGVEKPLKYPVMFHKCELALINKIDLEEALEFDTDTLEENIRKVNPKIRVMKLSARTGEGFEQWIEWIKEKVG